MILIKMDRLGIDPEKYKNLELSEGKSSYVLINPPNDFSLKTGDIVYLLKTGFKKGDIVSNTDKELRLEDKALIKVNIAGDENNIEDLRY